MHTPRETLKMRRGSGVTGMRMKRQILEGKSFLFRFPKI